MAVRKRKPLTAEQKAHRNLMAKRRRKYKAESEGRTYRERVKRSPEERRKHRNEQAKKRRAAKKGR